MMKATGRGHSTWSILCLVFLLAVATHALAAEHPTEIVVREAWARPSIQGGSGAVYLTIENRGDRSFTLIGASSEVAEVVELHETTFVPAGEAHHGESGHDHHEDGQTGGAHEHHHHDDHLHHDPMHHGHHDGDGALADGTFVMLHRERVEIPAGSTVVFEPAGLHIMLINLTRTLAWGSTFQVELHFEGAAPIVTTVTVGAGPEG